MIAVLIDKVQEVRLVEQLHQVHCRSSVVVAEVTINSLLLVLLLTIVLFMLR